MPPIIEELQNKKIAIMGFGREGKSVYQYIRKYLPHQPLTIADEREIDTSSLTYVHVQCGDRYQYLDGFDYIIKSPGIVLAKDVDLTTMNSMTNLFLKHYGKQTVGVTGTKGKSTTASLLYHILKKNGENVVFLGNIGKPAFDALEDITENTIVVFELSCHQLEYVEYNPHIAVLLNIYEEHLDHYGTYAKYVHAKENVWRYQQTSDYLICEDVLIHHAMKSHVTSVSMEHEQADIYADVHDITIGSETISFSPMLNPLLGHHNMYDISIDFYIAHTFFHLTWDACKDALSSFQPLPHRLQYVGNYHDIHWYDDSISTICETTIQALQALPQTTTLLIGGMDRGIDYTPLADYIKAHPVEHVIVMPDSGEVLAQLLPDMNICHVKDLQEAVKVSCDITKKDGLVLLSPAAASYGFFKNFEDRGECYQNYIKKP